MSNFSDFFPNLSSQEEIDLKADLESLQITQKFWPMVRYVKDSEMLKDIIYNNFEDERNVLIFGTMGSGKTQMVRQCAEQCGMHLEEITVSTKLPEDFGGVPLTLKRDLADDDFRGVVADRLYEEKLDIAVDDELKKHPEYGVSAVARRMLRRRLASTIDVTDDEVTANLGRFADKRERLEQRTSAPEWVWNIIDNYTKKKQKTVLFLDEINQGRPDVLNTLFQLILDKRFGSEDKYSFRDAVVFAAAGNFPRENPDVSPLSQPLMNRFNTIVIYRTHWAGSINYIGQQYLSMRDEYPKLCELLRSSSLTSETWSTAFTTPRDADLFVQRLAKYEEAAKKDPNSLARIKDLTLIGLPLGASANMKKAVTRFMTEIGAPAFASVSTAPDAVPSMGRKQRSMRSNLQIAWTNFNLYRVYEIGGTTYRKGTDDKQFIEDAVRENFLVTTDDLVTIKDSEGRSIMDAYLQLGGSKQTLEGFLH